MANVSINVTWAVPLHGDDGIKFNQIYLASIPSILKMIEFLLLLISFALIADLVDTTADSWKELEFLLGIGVTTWIFVIALFVMGVFNIQTIVNKKMPGFLLLIGILHMIFAFILLISCGMSLNDAKHLNKNTMLSDSCSFIDKYKTSAVFGIMASIVLLIDEVLHLLSWARASYNDSQASKIYLRGNTDEKNTNRGIED